MKTLAVLTITLLAVIVPLFTQIINPLLERVIANLPH